MARPELDARIASRVDRMWEDGLVDEIRLAVSESTSRAVSLNARHAAEVPVKILVSDDPSGLTLSVTDAGPAAGPGPDDLSEELLAGTDGAEPADPDVALAVLTGLVDDVVGAAG